MKWTLLLITLLTFSSTTFSQVTLENCVSDATDFLSEVAPAKELSSNCFPLIEGTRNNINEDNSSDDFVLITVYKNILYTKVHVLDVNSNMIIDANRITAGHKSKLTDGIAVDFLEDNAKIYVLNKNGSDYSILSFIYNVSGNLTPSRELNSSELSQATNITADFTLKKLFVVSSTAAWIKSFNLKADPLGKRAENSSDLQNSIFGVASGLTTPIDIKIKGTEIFVLDNDRVLVFNTTDNGSIAPKRIISGANTTLSGSKRLEINSSDQIEVTNGDNSVVKFGLTSSGNISPL